MLRKVISGWVALGICMSLAASLLADETRVVNVKITVDKEGGVDVDAKKPAVDPPFTGERPAVDVAILLDTSNSMDGLISQAKSQLWTIVQEFAEAKKKGQTPLLRVALFEYGNAGLPASEGYIRQVVQLTDDLDKLSEALFALKTNGGDEYCGQVIDAAITRLGWSKEPNSFKAIFIAGNEPFTQGPVDFHKSCKRAIEEGIVVNTIHCGAYQTGINGKWQDGAKLAEGEYFNIDQDRAVVHINCPQDKVIIELNAKLNKTYLWFGKRDVRNKFAENQVEQDENARGLSSQVLAGRAITKAGSAYNNESRDLVDAVAKKPGSLKDIAEKELPEQLQKMTPAEREAHVLEMSKKRKAIQSQIAKLKVQREAHIVKVRKNNAGKDGGNTLGDAVVGAVKKQLQKSGFETK